MNKLPHKLLCYIDYDLYQQMVKESVQSCEIGSRLPYTRIINNALRKHYSKKLKIEAKLEKSKIIEE